MKDYQESQHQEIKHTKESKEPYPELMHSMETNDPALSPPSASPHAMPVFETTRRRRRESLASATSRRSVASHDSDRSGLNHSGMQSSGHFGAQFGRNGRSRRLSLLSVPSIAISDNSSSRSVFSNALSRRTSHADDSDASDSNSSLGETDEDVWFPHSARGSGDINLEELDQLLNLSDDQVVNDSVIHYNQHAQVGHESNTHTDHDHAFRPTPIGESLGEHDAVNGASLPVEAAAAVEMARGVPSGATVGTTITTTDGRTPGALSSSGAAIPGTGTGSTVGGAEAPQQPLRLVSNIEPSLNAENAGEAPAPSMSNYPENSEMMEPGTNDLEKHSEIFHNANMGHRGSIPQSAPGQGTGFDLGVLDGHPKKQFVQYLHTTRRGSVVRPASRTFMAPLSADADSSGSFEKAKENNKVSSRIVGDSSNEASPELRPTGSKGDGRSNSAHIGQVENVRPSTNIEASGEVEQFAQSQRFSFYAPGLENTIHSPDLASLVGDSQSFGSLLDPANGTWFLDCFRPTAVEMKALSRAFGIHPLSTEDIQTEDAREKYEQFKNYYLVVYHTFENNKNDPNYLQSINFYILVFKEGVISFHFEPVSHCRNVRRRMRQLRDYVDFSPDWIAYALVDDITDSFAPEISTVEKEADFVEDAVYLNGEIEMYALLQRLGEARKYTMQLLRMLSGKADVVRGFAKRCTEGHTQPASEMGLYLGDIQDHIVTMYQNLSAYEKIFSRAHFNYMGLLQMEFVDSSNRMTSVLGKVTMLGSILLPMNLITGLFGMNVKVPGESVENLHWFFGILGLVIFLATALFVIGVIYLRLNSTNKQHRFTT